MAVNVTGDIGSGRYAPPTKAEPCGIAVTIPLKGPT